MSRINKPIGGTTLSRATNLSIYLIIYGFVSAQALAQNTIEGRILSQADRQPLPFATVFINNTTQGQLSTDKGLFSLKTISTKTIELIVTYVGYETFMMKIQPDTLTKPLLILMKPKANELKEVTIKRLRNGFEEFFPLFQENFIGLTEFSESCKIKNKEAIWFSLSDDKSVLSVNADEPIIIENKALGYIIKYQLEAFTCDFKRSYTSFLGYAFFEEILLKSTRQRQKIEENQKKAYLGSPQHFFKSVIARQCSQEGYAIYKLIKTQKYTYGFNAPQIKNDSAENSKRPFKMTKTVDSTNLKLSNDSTFKTLPNQNVFGNNNVQYVSREPLPETAIATYQNGDYMLVFEQFLYVVYNNERDDLKHTNHKPTPQISIISLPDKEAIIAENGYLIDPLSVLFEGRWAREKLGDLLPIEYVLKK